MRGNECLYNVWDHRDDSRREFKSEENVTIEIAHIHPALTRWLFVGQEEVRQELGKDCKIVKVVKDGLTELGLKCWDAHARECEETRACHVSYAIYTLLMTVRVSFDDCCTLCYWEWRSLDRSRVFGGCLCGHFWWKTRWSEILLILWNQCRWRWFFWQRCHSTRRRPHYRKFSASLGLTKAHHTWSRNSVRNRGTELDQCVISGVASFCER